MEEVVEGVQSESTPPSPDPEPAVSIPADEWNRTKEYVGELENKIDTMQENFDSFIEEYSINKQNKDMADPIKDEVVPEVKIEEPKAPIVEPVVDKVIEPKPVDDAEIETAIKGEQAWRQKIEQNQEDLLMEREVNKLKAEVDAAMIQYPNADRERILLEVETDSEDSVATIAERSHTKETARIEKIKQEAETGIKEQLAKEGPGSLSLPPSSGPGKPVSEGQSPSFEREADAWSAAAMTAKKTIIGE
jgi:hypothetical protein